MYGVLLTIHVIVCVLVVLIVLVQAGRSGGLSGLMGGGGGGDALFSTSSQQSGLRKMTLILAMLFMATSFALTLLSNRSRRTSVFEQQFPNLPPVGDTSAPVTPGQ